MANNLILSRANGILPHLGSNPARTRCQTCRVLLQLQGSVFPKAMLFAVPCALISAFLKMFSLRYALGDFVEVFNDSAAFSGFSLVLGFLFVFRTNIAYNRYWEGVTAGHRMCAEWLDAASNIIAFTKVSKAPQEKIEMFEKRFLEFLSLLHGVAVGSLRDVGTLDLSVLDLEGLHPTSITALKDSEYPVTLLFQWMQRLVIEHVDNGVLGAPPPILTRAFQELANGMVAYHDACKIQTTHVPFPYKQMSVVLLIFHWAITPLVMCMWTKKPLWSFVFTFVQALIFWCLYITAADIEFPFQHNSNAYAVSAMHHEFNAQLKVVQQAGSGMLENTVGARPRLHNLSQSLSSACKNVSKRTPEPPPKGDGIRKGCDPNELDTSPDKKTRGESDEQQLEKVQCVQLQLEAKAVNQSHAGDDTAAHVAPAYLDCPPRASAALMAEFDVVIREGTDQLLFPSVTSALEINEERSAQQPKRNKALALGCWSPNQCFASMTGYGIQGEAETQRQDSKFIEQRRVMRPSDCSVNVSPQGMPNALHSHSLDI